ncbi:MAG TPA: ATP-binding protein [Rhodocyclaceae bacterium]|nr:ATP-binding protein [Rhodocyclaceae bacterium]
MDDRVKGVAEDRQDAGEVSRRDSLQSKAVWTVVVLFAYFILVTLVITYERDIMLEAVTRLQEKHRQEERLVALNMSVSRTVLAVNENYFSPNLSEAAKVLVLEVEAIMPGLNRLQPDYPMLGNDLAGLQRAVDELSSAPSRATIADLRGTLHRLVIELDVVTNDVNARKQSLLEDYRRAFNRVTLEWAVFGVFAIGLLGGFILLFFRRLAQDIERVRERAGGIVRGYRGEPLEQTRHDELGALIDAVNQMQQELRQRESQIEIARQQHFHKEKMAAIGSLAAAVAHEINNPLSAIVGVAQAIDQECKSANCGNLNQICHPGMILDQAKRVMQITRQISEFSVPQSQEPELLDVNGLLRSTGNFVKFDRRFRLLELELSLDTSLPAICVIADHLVQVAMNLLINAADALQGRTDPAPKIRVVTSQRGGMVAIDVSDNGTGIDPAHLGLVFNEHFTTKGPGRGSGLGLALCRSLIREAGGDISIASTLGLGTTVTVLLPIPVIGSHSGEREERERI